jgi:hypothetical protein
VETTHNFEKDLRCQILGLLVIPHLAIDVVVDQAKVFLVKCLKIRGHFFHTKRLMRSPNEWSHVRPPMLTIYALWM